MEMLSSVFATLVKEHFDYTKDNPEEFLKHALTLMFPGQDNLIDTALKEPFLVEKISSLTLMQHNKKRLEMNMQQVEELTDYDHVNEQYIKFLYKPDGEKYKEAEEKFSIIPWNSNER
jgi:hypothetical protein